MILLNKTMMCGGLVVLAPGSPLQVLFAILIMLLQLLFVLKLAPYVKDSEDWSAFFSTLGLCLLSLGAYSMMLDMEAQQRTIIDLVTTALPLLCIAIVLCIMVSVDGGVWQKMQDIKKGRVGKMNASKTQVLPVNVGEPNQQLEKNIITTEAEKNVRSWE